MLAGIGGFDEEYEFYLDETDVCCRLVDAGYNVRQLSGAAVHHKFLPGHLFPFSNVFPYDPSGFTVQYNYAACDRLGNARLGLTQPADDYKRCGQIGELFRLGDRVIVDEGDYLARGHRDITPE